MVILVLSDSHTDVDTMELVFSNIQPDAVVHLGDSIVDAILLQSRHKNVRFEMVRGNIDTGSDRPDQSVVSFDSVPVFITHGDRYHVETGLSEIAKEGRDAGARLVLHGHTHVPGIAMIEGMTVMNPGRIGRVSSKKIKASFGVVETIGQDVRCSIHFINFLDTGG